MRGYDEGKVLRDVRNSTWEENVSAAEDIPPLLWLSIIKLLVPIENLYTALNI